MIAPEFSPEQARLYTDEIEAFAERYRGDDAFRAHVDSGAAVEEIDDLGLRVREGVALRVVADTEDVRHLVLPPDPNAELSDEALSGVSAGGAASSLATVGCGGSFACSTVPSTVSSTSSVSSASSH